ncbi:MAG: Rne/Rng family ribonuclease [Acidobacteriota bacterium]|nr:Rne/Rng family ribonuclease [Acidobacteriota bacterium]
MSKELIVSASSQETKAAILEGGEVVEIHIEREGDQGIVGSICKGRVTKVLPGMQSAFVNVGLERDAFLYVSDFFEDTDEYDLIAGTADEPVAKPDQAPGPETARQPAPGGEDSGGARHPDRRMRPRRARRGRLRGKRQEAAPSEPSAAAAESPAPPPPPASVSGPPESLSVLPGETLAKYAAVSEPPPAVEPEGEPQDTVQSEPAATAETASTTEPLAQSEPSAAEETTVQPEPTAAGEPAPATEPESRPLKGRRGRRRSRQAATESAEADASAASPEAAKGPDTEAEVHADGEAGTAEVEEPTAQAEEPTAESVTVEVEETTAESGPSTGDSEPTTEASSEAAADSVTLSEEPEAATEETPPGPAQAESGAEEPGEEAEAAWETDAQAPPESDAAEETDSAGEPTPEVAEPAAEVAADEPGAAAAATDDDAGEQVAAAEASTAVDSPEEQDAISTETDQAREPAPAEVAESPDSPADGPSASAGEGPSDPNQPEDPNSTGEAAEPESETVGAAKTSSGPASRPRASNAQYRSRPSTPRFFRRSPDRRRSQNRGEDRQRREASSPAPMIADLLKEGQEILVQIAKEPLGTKGARITSHIAIPGRYLVYMPTVNHIGVSRKISSGDERQRLRRIIQDNRGDLPGGFIVRTAGEYKGEDEFKADIGFLRALWTEVKTQSDKKSAPAIIHRELNLVQRILRDQFNREFSAIRVDNELAYASIVELIHRFQPSLVKKVKLYTRETPIFEEFGVQAELDKALRSKVWLKSGGYIVIDQAEALVAIDVNTGKYVGKSNKLEDTIAKTNMEAAKEIARQLRLRDLGGIIVCDFIDMEDRKNRLKVTQTLEQALRRDKSPSKVLQFNDFGLVAITRKRVKQSLLKALCEPCSECCGSGMVKSPQTVCYEIQGEARKMASAIEDPEITIRVHPRVAKALKTTEASVVDELESSLKKDLVIKSDPLFPQERFDIF